MIIVSDVKVKWIEDHAPGFPSGSVRSLGQAVSVVRQLIEREQLAPRVICASANPDSELSFEDVRRVIVVDGDGDIRDNRSPEPIYTPKGSKERLRLVLGITALEESGALAPFVSVPDLVGTVYNVWQFRLIQSMRKTCDTAVSFIAAIAKKSDDANLLVGYLAEAAAAYVRVQTGEVPDWAPEA